jgi:hypothetical protein
MTKYTPEEKAAIFAESRRILSEELIPPPERPAPEPEPPPLVFEDDVARWRREADEADARREAARAQLRRESRDAERARGLDWMAHIDAYVEQRIAAALVEHQHGVVELAKSVVEFANATDGKLLELERLLTKLDARQTSLHALDDTHRGTIIDMPSPLVRKERVN